MKFRRNDTEILIFRPDGALFFIFIISTNIQPLRGLIPDFLFIFLSLQMQLLLIIFPGRYQHVGLQYFFETPVYLPACK